MTTKPHETHRLTAADPARTGQEPHAPTPAEQRTARIMGAWFLVTGELEVPVGLTPLRALGRVRPSLVRTDVMGGSHRVREDWTRKPAPPLHDVRAEVDVLYA